MNIIQVFNIAPFYIYYDEYGNSIEFDEKLHKIVEPRLLGIKVKSFIDKEFPKHRYFTEYIFLNNIKKTFRTG